MDVEELLKYKLPEGYTPADSNKKRKGDVPFTTQAARENPASTNAAGSSPSSIPSGGENGKAGGQGEKGGRGGGRGKGNGKGGKRNKGGKGEYEATSQQILTTHAKAILRLEQERRERDRSIQWAIDFKLPYHLPVQLQHAVEVHRTNKPEEGNHPDGNINDVQWRIFASSVYADFEKLEVSREDYDTVQTVLQFLNFSVYKVSERGPDGTRTTCTLLKPAHRIVAESKTWTWLFRLRQDTARGREAHEKLLTCSEAFEKFHTHVAIRKDRAPRDGLTRQIEQQLSGLRI